MIQPSTLRFLKNLKSHNHKEWFDANRPLYEDAKKDFGQLVQLLIDRHGKKDADIAQLQVKECVFRINRDVRFSKDKSPYKTNMGAYLVKGGKKSIFAGYYFHLEPGNKSFVGGGLWMPMPEELKKVRQEIDYCFDEFSSIVRGKKFKAQYNDLDRSAEYTLSRPPKGYEEDNPAIDYLKLKSLVTLRPVSDAELTSKELPSKILGSFEALQPLLVFINRALEA
jgi:uncharacterized protein (TIGR02453 family)